MGIKVTGNIEVGSETIVTDSKKGLLPPQITYL